MCVGGDDSSPQRDVLVVLTEPIKIIHIFSWIENPYVKTRGKPIQGVSEGTELL